MAASVPCSDSMAAPGGQGPEAGQPRQVVCLSSDCGSEGNDAFPNALAVDSRDAVAPGQTGFLRSTSKRIVGAFRRTTADASNPGGHDTPRREDTTTTAVQKCTAAVTHDDDDGKNKDSPRIAVPSRPAEPRRSANAFTSRARDVSRKLSELIGVVGVHTSSMGSGSDGRAGTALDWKPHERILKALGYRPRGHGQRFIDEYKLGEILGTGGFGVVREGE